MVCIIVSQQIKAIKGSRLRGNDEFEYVCHSRENGNPVKETMFSFMWESILKLGSRLRGNDGCNMFTILVKTMIATMTVENMIVIPVKTGIQ
jgi:hypothetical protein